MSGAQEPDLISLAADPSPAPESVPACATSARSAPLTDLTPFAAAPPGLAESDPRSSALGLQTALLVASITVVLLAALLSIEPDQRTVVLRLGGGGASRVAIPEVCTSRRLWGVDCLGCGLTRSFISFAHGRLSESWSYNPGGFVLFVAVLLQVPYRAVQLWRLRSGRAAWECWLAGQLLFGVLLVLMVSHWLLKHWGA